MRKGSVRTVTRARDERLDGVGAALGDCLAGSYKFPLAAGLGAGGATLWFVAEFMPDLVDRYDSGPMMLAALGVPMVLVAGALTLWARRRRTRRAAERAAANAVGDTLRRIPADPPRSAPPEPDGLSSAAVAALDRNALIEAIKIVRAERGVGLAEAKAIVDRAMELRRRR